MKTTLLGILTTFLLLTMPSYGFAQAPTLGSAGDFVLFTTIGAVSNSGLSQLTGNVGSNNGSITAFGNVNGVMHNADGTSAEAASDLLIACGLIDNMVPAYFPAPLLGNGVTLTPGVYSIAGNASLDLDLTLDAQGDAHAVFVFQIQGSLSTAANSSIVLKNGALACNVFWKVEGLVSMASNTSMKGTVIANNAAIVMSTGSTLEGRALSTSGAITVDGVLAYIPTDYDSPVLTGPNAPALASLACYALLTGNGEMTNTGISYITGDVGTNVGLTTGFDSLTVTGMIHPIPDVSTATCAADLLTVYNYLNLLPYDIELLFPAQFGNNLVLTPHTYLLNAATVFTDTLFLDARNNEDAVFVIKINGALSTSTYATVALINGAQAKNVYWKVEGAVSINEYSSIVGTLIANNGAVSLLSGATLEGRAFTTDGSLTVAASTVTITEGCTQTVLPSVAFDPNSNAVIVTPSPFSTFLTIRMRNASKQGNRVFTLYNAMGNEMTKMTLVQDLTTVQAGHIGTGMYFYIITENGQLIQTGKLIK